MTIEMLQNARNWAAKHQKFASGWGSAPDPAGGLPSPDPLKWPPPSQILGYATASLHVEAGELPLYLRR